MNGHLDQAAIAPLLRGRFGTPYLWHASCPSTQDVLRAEGLPEGAVAVAEHQTAGRGRAGRSWEDAPSRSILCSVLLRPPRLAEQAQLSLVVGLATAEAIEETTGLAAQLKWPNDVLVGGRKVAGILLEAAEGSVVAGIGINVAQREDELPAETRVRATSLCVELASAGRSQAIPERPWLLAGLLGRLEEHYDTWCVAGLGPLLTSLEARNALSGRTARAGSHSGVVGGFSPNGRLELCQTDGQVVLITSGELELLP